MYLHPYFVLDTINLHSLIKYRLYYFSRNSLCILIFSRINFLQIYLISIQISNHFCSILILNSTQLFKFFPSIHPSSSFFLSSHMSPNFFHSYSYSFFHSQSYSSNFFLFNSLLLCRFFDLLYIIHFLFSSPHLSLLLYTL